MFLRRANSFTQEFIEYPGSETINQKLNYSKEGSTIEVFMIGKQIPDDVIEAWKNKLVKSDLQSTELKVIQNQNNSEELAGSIGDRVKSGIIKELYQNNVAELRSKNLKIQNLTNEIKNLQGAKIDWIQLQKEIFIQYPNLENLTYGSTIRLDSISLDTIPTLLPIWKDENQSSQLKRWLQVRIGQDKIQVIDQNKF
jgi:hypothetical protein